jgi:hypothetical protein
MNRCWEWLGSKPESRGGYGQLYLNGRTQLAHRVVFERFNGEVPADLTLDHLCRNRSCVNPDHLEPVSITENIRRGTPFKPKKTHCPSGHPYDEANTGVYRGERQCKACNRARALARYHRKKAGQ